MKLEVVIFRDHAKGTKKYLTCAIAGFLLAEDDEQCLYTWWETFGDLTIQEDDENREHFVLLKSAIIKRTKISLGKTLLKELHKHQ